MGESFQRARLLRWALGTFHSGLFVLAIVLPLYQTGVLDDVLSGLSTPLGRGIYGLLWTITWWSTGRAIAGLDWSRLEAADVGDLLRRGLGWGGATGSLFVLGLAAFFIGATIVAVFVRGIPGAGDPSLAFAPVVVTAAAALPIAAVVGFVIGAVIGAVFALLDALALLACRLLLGRPLDNPDVSTSTR
jgi:hypothetical protein